MKILVGVPTYSGGKYCRKMLLKYLGALSYDNLSFLFVTNSGEEDQKELIAMSEPLKKPGISVAVLTNEIDGDAQDKVVANRNKIREYFLAGEWDALFFLDHDVIGPTNVLETFVKCEKKMVSGWYLAAFNYDGKPRILPLAYVHDKPGHARQLSIKDVLVPRLMKIAAAGLGCTLIHRSILEKVDFIRGKGTEDAIFYERVRQEAGEDLWLDTRAKFWHFKFAPNDKRNALYDPRRYQLQVKKK